MRPEHTWRSIALAVVAIGLLNFALSMHNIWPTPWITTRYEVAVEVAALVLLMTSLLIWRGQPGRLARGVIATIIVLFVIGRYADVTAPALYGRPINLYWDAQHLPGVLAMLGRAAKWWQPGVFTIVIVLLAGLAFWIATTIVNTIFCALARPRARRFSSGLSLLVIGLWAASQTTLLPGLSPWFSQPVTAGIVQHSTRLVLALGADHKADLKKEPLLSSSFDALNRANVFVMFIESYGATTYDKATQATAFGPARQALAQAARKSGRQVVSAFVESPTFGGGSWLAHSSFLSGHRVENQDEYDQLLASSRDNWVTRFNSQGYRTAALVPGIRLAWPEGAYYGFDIIYDAKRLQYPGPDFGWWRIPDQFALAQASSLELFGPHPHPVMLFFTSITSHAPFQPVAPYLESWSQLLQAKPYGDAADIPELAGKPDWQNLTPSYVESIAYALKTLTGFLEHAAPETLIIVLGDHQPAASVTGPNARWAVPVHVLGRQAEILDTLRHQGFSNGMTPGEETAKPMHQLTNILLKAFSGTTPD